MTGVALAGAPKPARRDFWRKPAAITPAPVPEVEPEPAPAADEPAVRTALELRVELATGAVLVLALPDGTAPHLTPAVARALRAAAAPLLAELASRGLAVTLEEP
jgi:hypothetical protein